MVLPPMKFVALWGWAILVLCNFACVPAASGAKPNASEQLDPEYTLPRDLRAIGGRSGKADTNSLNTTSGCVKPRELDVMVETCRTPLVKDEPLCNSALAQNSTWAITHSSTYSQGSSSFAGPSKLATMKRSRISVVGTPVNVVFTPPYPDGRAAGWAYVTGLGTIVKFDPDEMVDIDRIDNAGMGGFLGPATSGAYTFMTNNFEFIVASSNLLSRYIDSSPTGTDRFSGIELDTQHEVTSLCDANDAFAGGTLRYDGSLVFVSVKGAILVFPLSEKSPLPDTASLATDGSPTMVNHDRCDNDSVVSNTMACDYDGNVYVVNSKELIKYDRDIVEKWSVPYKTDEDAKPQLIRLGPGSGSSPSLMGTALDDDRFVVITDGQHPMHLLFIWRDNELPSDWSGLGEGYDPRVACDVPITFDLDDPSQSISEQSVLVRGYAAVLTNNFLRTQPPNLGDNLFTSILAILYGGLTSAATPGVQRVDWDPTSRTCKTKWINNEIYVPNAIPTMSAASDTMYAVGTKRGAWGLHALDFQTGKALRFWRGPRLCSTETLDFLSALSRPDVSQWTLVGCGNSAYAATEIGPDGAVFSGTFGGIVKYDPSRLDDQRLTVASMVEAGLGQCVDLVNRALLIASEDACDERIEDLSLRGVTQMNAVLEFDGDRRFLKKRKDTSVDAYVFELAEQARSNFQSAVEDLSTAIGFLKSARAQCREAQLKSK